MQSIAQQVSWRPAIQSAIDAASLSAVSGAQTRTALALGLKPLVSASKVSLVGIGAAEQNVRLVSDIVAKSTSITRIADAMGPVVSLHSLAESLSAPTRLGISSDVARWGLAGAGRATDLNRIAEQLSNVAGVTAGLNNVIAGLGPRIDMASWMSSDWARLMDGVRPQGLASVQSMMATAAQMVQPREALHEISLRVVRSAIALGERIYFAVLAARTDAIHGDVDAVSEFLEKWMDLPRSRRPERVQAGMDVLLDVEVENFNPDTAFELLDSIEKETNRRFLRGHRPLWETNLNHRQVVLMGELPILTGMSGEAPESFLPASCSAEDRALFVLHQTDDERILALMFGLTDRERRVLLAKMITQESWEQVAQRFHMSPAEGERTRAKFRRRAKQVRAMFAGSSSLFAR